MPFDASQVMENIKRGMSPNDKKQTSNHQLALASCLDDMALRYKSIAGVSNYEVSITAGDRSITLSGTNDNLQDIWFIKIGSGVDQKTLIYKSPEVWFDNYDNPAVGAGIPTYYTIIAVDNGFPIVKVDVPFSAPDTMLVYYFLYADQNRLSGFRSTAAITIGAKAYFYGIETEKGAALYANFANLIVLSKAQDDYKKKSQRKFAVNKIDQSVMTQIKVYNNERF